MNYLLNNLILISSIVVFLITLIKSIRKLYSATNTYKVNLSWIWKMGLIILLIGIAIQFFNYINIFNELQENPNAEDLIKEEIKSSLIYRSCYVGIFILSIILWFILKKYSFFIFKK